MMMNPKEQSETAGKRNTNKHQDPETTRKPSSKHSTESDEVSPPDD